MSSHAYAFLCPALTLMTMSLITHFATDQVPRLTSHSSRIALDSSTSISHTLRATRSRASLLSQGTHPSLVLTFEVSPARALYFSASMSSPCWPSPM